MKIQDYWEKQKKQNLSYWIKDYDKLSLEEIDEKNAKYILSIIDNLIQMQNETPWKMHALEKKEGAFNSVNFTLCAVDVFKLLMSVLMVNGIGIEDFIDSLNKKDEYIEAMNGFKVRKPLSGKAVCIDIDGVIFDYRGGMAEFLSKKGYILSRELKSYHIWKDIEGLDYDSYEKLYREFVYGGGYKNLELMESIVPEAIKGLKDLGYLIVLVSSRPVNKYPNAASDTYESLRLKNIVHDLVLFGKDKAELIEDLHPVKVEYFVDDVAKHVVEVSQIGIESVLLDRTYNKDIVIKRKNVIRVDNFAEFKCISRTPKQERI